MENTARIYIMGAAAVLVSGVKLEDWKLMEKYEPEAIRIVDETGDQLFRVMTVNGAGSVNRYGVCWGSYTSEEGYATVTVLLDEDVEDKKDAVMETMGSAVLDLMTVEEVIPEIVAEIREKQKLVESCITAV